MWCTSCSPCSRDALVAGLELQGEVVDVSGPALTLHPLIAALVETAVKLAEERLWRHHEQRLEQLRRSAQGVLATVPGPLVLLH